MHDRKDSVQAAAAAAAADRSERAIDGASLLFNLDVSLFQGENLLSDQVHLMKLVGNCDKEAHDDARGAKSINQPWPPSSSSRLDAIQTG